MSILDFTLSNDAYDLRSLTRALNILDKPMLGPDQYFVPEPVMHPQFAVEIKSGTMTLIDSVPVGGQSKNLDDVTRKVYPFQTYRFPTKFRVTAADIANKRAFGQENMAMAVDAALAEKMQWGRDKLLNQQAYMKWGAIKGVVLDGDGLTTLYNWFTEFGVTEESVTFALTTDATHVVDHCDTVINHIADNIGGDSWNGEVHGWCGKTFWQQLISHPEVTLVEIQGHTDSRGKRSYNLALSERRARSVRQYLIDAGVEPSRLMARGYGPDRPISPNITRRGRSQNRRVEFHIRDQQ